MKKIFLSILFVLAGCAPGPVCLRSHKEDRIVQDPPNYVKMGYMMMPIGGGPRKEMVEICDEYGK